MKHRMMVRVALAATLALVSVSCSNDSTSDPAGSDGEEQLALDDETAEGEQADGGDEQAQPDTTVPIGFLGNLTGPAASLGIPCDEGLQLALEDIESSGVLTEHGVGLEILKQDTGSDPTNAVTIFNEFVDQGVPVAVSDGISPVALAVGPIANDTETAFITGAGSGSPEEDFEFHLSDITTQYNLIAPYLVEQGGPRVAALVVEDNPAFPFLTDQLESGLEAAGGEIVHRETIAASDTDFSSALTNVRETEPDVVFISSLADQAGNIIAQMEQVGGFDDVLVSIQSGIDSTVADIAGSAAEGVVLRPAWAIGSAGSEEFTEAYREAYGEGPETTAALCYQTAWIIASAIDMTLQDGDEVTGEALRARIPAASESDMVAEHGVIPEFVIHPDGSTTWPGVLATFSSDGEIVATEDS